MGAFLQPGLVSSAAGGGGGKLGTLITYASPSGTVASANPAGFTANVGQINVTLTADTIWQGLTAGASQQEVLIVNTSAFNLTLAAPNFLTAAGGLILPQNASALAIYNTGSINAWQLR